MDLGTIRGFKTRFHLYTVPGQVFYDASRKLILKGADGVVFVADSQIERMESNLESWENLEGNLNEQGQTLRTVPHVIQYNKRDLPNIVPLDEMQAALNEHNAPWLEACATQGGRRVRNAEGLREAGPDRPQEENGGLIRTGDAGPRIRLAGARRLLL